MSTRHRLGALPSPFDPRDYPLAALYAVPAGVVLPDRARALGIPAPPYRQDGGKCVAFSAAGDQTIEETPEAGGQVRFDADELYARCKEQDGDPTGEGTYIRVAASIRLKRGIRATTGPNAGSFLRIASYVRPSLTVAELEASIYAASQGIGGAPWVAGNWPQNWMASPSSGVLPTPGPAEGGHAFKVIEYWRSHPVGHCSRILNSWGSTWGENGEAWVRTSDLLSMLWEQWKTFDAPDQTGGTMNFSGLTPLLWVRVAPGGAQYKDDACSHAYPEGNPGYDEVGLYAYGKRPDGLLLAAIKRPDGAVGYIDGKLTTLLGLERFTIAGAVGDPNVTIAWS